MADDIRIELDELSPPELIDALCEALPDGWSRDGILEHQVSTREEVQYCFRREGVDDEVPRCALCLAGPGEVLTVAAVVPIDRGVELSDDQSGEVVAEFYRDVVRPVVEARPASAELVGAD